MGSDSYPLFFFLGLEQVKTVATELGENGYVNGKEGKRADEL